jgi:hypothetical protein
VLARGFSLHNGFLFFL